MMKERTLRVLEFTKIRDRLASKAMTDMGRERCEALVPSSNMTEIQRMQAETEEATVILQYVGASPLVPFSDVRASLTLAEKGATLSPKALLEVAALMQSARAARKALDTERDNTPILKELAQRLSTLHNIEQDITNAIISEDEIADRASNELMDIRRHLRGANERIKEKLNQMIRSSAFQKYLQDPIVTMRNDRYCLPVKAEYRGSVPGLVHDQSSTGATLFIEPMAAVEMGNELKTWAAKEKQEIERILAALSAEIAPYADQLRETVETLAELDYIFAKGMLSREMNAVSPKLNRNGYINIIRGRHPLIDREKVVPSNLWMGKDFTSLIITGPNTGGKTVTLKTVGLLTLMAQAGLQVPADLGTELAVFEQVFADIGDEQSIEQSLSTFSAHMSNTVEILRQADDDSLILFDELGAGTDPVEGAALAIAIIQHARSKGALIAATTHYAELKTFAMTTAGVENASCEFDVQTLRPTYRLLVGIPGKSNAFAISRRLGLDESVIADAKAQMDSESLRFEDVLAQLEEKRQRLEKAQTEANRLWQQRQEDARKARVFREQMEKAKENARAKGEAEAKRIVREAQQKTEEIFAQLEELRKQQTRAANFQQMNDAKAAIRHDLKEAEAVLHSRDEEAEAPAPSRPIAVGDLVELAGVKTAATVLNVNDDGSMLLQAGKMKMTVKAGQVRLLESAEEIEKRKKQAAAAQRKSVSPQIQLAARAASELDIRGMETLEAESVVENYIDAAVMAKLGTVTIIHGKGTGALRKAVHEMLKRNRAVKSFRLGRYGEGEAGVTVVELK